MFVSLFAFFNRIFSFTDISPLKNNNVELLAAKRFTHRAFE